VQTFLPFPDFSESARVLDSARLGKQRVEALQVLRAIVLPSYGWQSHPAMQMWRGYVPALTRYSLDMVDEWTRRGHADSTRPLITEFAPEATDGAALALPSWLGEEAVHLSHRSNLVRTAPEFYTPRFLLLARNRLARSLRGGRRFERDSGAHSASFAHVDSAATQYGRVRRLDEP
jgi:hypothetical protein